MDNRKKITCKVCNKTYNEYHYIHYHLKSKYHKTRVEKLSNETKEQYEISGLKSRVETMEDEIEKLQNLLLELNPATALDF